MHPDLFSAFEDIAGDLAPNSGTKAQTVARLYGGNAAAYAEFDPSAVLAKHGPYNGVSGWFAISGSPQPKPHVSPAARRRYGGGRDPNPNPGDQTVAANTLCRLGSANGIHCAVVAQTGKHDWPFAAHAFAAALPWLAGQIGTPGVPRIPFPSATAPTRPSSPQLQAARK
jgi:S-formylglutathione hydrolase FrmB